MYKLLIVDDEPLVQVGIKSMLDWASIEIEICGVAGNGKIALDMIENVHPDIIITDIKMPIMTGLELAAEANKKYNDKAPAFIILTSYEDFNYVREAMHTGVCDYLVKLELTPDLLKESVLKIVEELKSKRVTEPAAGSASVIDSYHDKFFISLLHNLFLSRDQFVLEQKELKLDFDFSNYIVSYVEIKSAMSDDNFSEAQLNLYHSAFTMSQSLFEKYCFCYTILLDIRHFAVIFCIKDESVDAPSLIDNAIHSVSSSLKNYYNVSLICGSGTMVSDPLSIAESFQYARDAYSNASVAVPHVKFELLEKSLDYKKSFNLAIFKDDLSRAFEEFDSELLEKALSEIIDLFKNHPGHYLQALDCASNILYMAISLIPSGEEVVSELFADHSDGYRSLYKLSTMDQIISWLTEFCEDLADYFTEHKKDTRKPIVSNIKHYIKTNVTEHLSLNEVAAVFGISPNYLSQLFTKYNDCGYNEYVTNCKINEARRLLTSGDYKVYEVAEMLGFENAFYFSKVFKKVVGVPPTTFMGN